MELKNFLKKIIILTAILFVISIFTTKVNAMTIVIDPGHGGNDSGTVKARIVRKKSYNDNF